MSRNGLSSEELHKALIAARTELQDVVLPILSDEKGSDGVRVGGCGIIVRSPIRDFVVTAWHVWDDLKAHKGVRFGDHLVDRSEVTVLASSSVTDLITLDLLEPTATAATNRRAWTSSNRARPQFDVATFVIGYPHALLSDTDAGVRVLPLSVVFGIEYLLTSSRTFVSQSGEQSEWTPQKDSAALPDIGFGKFEGLSGSPAFQLYPDGYKLVGIYLGAGVTDLLTLSIGRVDDMSDDGRFPEVLGS